MSDAAPRVQVCIGVDVDAVAGWLGSYGGQDSPNDIQRGMFAGEVGAPRLLRLFDRLGIATSWRPQVLLMLERLITYWSSRPEVEFVTFAQAADTFRARYPFDEPRRPTPFG